MRAALLGFTQSGKSTLLKAISGKSAPPAAAAGITQTIIPVPDERIDWLKALHKPKKTTYATIECLDMPGLSLTEAHGQAAARALLREARLVDMLVLVARAFESPTVPPYRESVDSARDLADLKSELLLADLEMVLNRIERLEKQIKKPTPTQDKDRQELALQKKLQEALEAGTSLSTLPLSEHEHGIIRTLNFLSLKPMLAVVNAGEDNWRNLPPAAAPLGAITLCASLEQELAELDPESRRTFMAELGVEKSAAALFVERCYAALGYISFLTMGPDEVRAWPVPKGITAVEAAGKIHSDIQRGFIRAATIAFQDLKTLGSEQAVKAAGKLRTEGKTYVVQDGDILDFRFNV